MGHGIAQLAARQYGVVSAAQLRGLGVAKYSVRRRVENGYLHPLHRGVYSVGLPKVSQRGRYLAAVLGCGPGAALSHRAAADVWGLRPNAAGRVEVTVPRTRVGLSGVEVHRTRMLHAQDFTTKDGIPVTSVARTLADLSAVVRPSGLEVAVDRAERLGIFDLTAVVDVLDRSKGRRGARALRRVVAAYRPSHQKSRLEREFRKLLDRAPDLGAPAFNALVDGEVGTHEVDVYWAEPKLAIQLDGFEFHRTRRDHERDAASNRDLELMGIRVMRLTWDDVTVHGQRTLRRVRLAGGWEAQASA